MIQSTPQKTPLTDWTFISLQLQNCGLSESEIVEYFIEIKKRGLHFNYHFSDLLVEEVKNTLSKQTLENFSVQFVLDTEDKAIASKLVQSVRANKKNHKSCVVYDFSKKTNHEHYLSQIWDSQRKPKYESYIKFLVINKSQYEKISDKIEVLHYDLDHVPYIQKHRFHTLHFLKLVDPKIWIRECVRSSCYVGSVGKMDTNQAFLYMKNYIKLVFLSKDNSSETIV